MRRLFALSLLALAPLASAAEFRAISENGVVMYDAPSARAKKLFVATRNYPVEVIASDGTWVKVRDMAGDLAWVERRQLVDSKVVIVTAAIAEVRQKPDEGAPFAFQAARGVILEIAPDQGPPGWLRVRHRDGATGFVRISQIWGL